MLRMNTIPETKPLPVSFSHCLSCVVTDLGTPQFWLFSFGTIIPAALIILLGGLLLRNVVELVVHSSIESLAGHALYALYALYRQWTAPLGQRSDRPREVDHGACLHVAQRRP